jgi:hypothetical protein
MHLLVKELEAEIVLFLIKVLRDLPFIASPTRDISLHDPAGRGVLQMHD